MAIYFITLNGSVYIIQGLFLYPVWISRYFIEVDVGLGILTLIFWFICLMSSPGFIKKPKNIEFLEIMKLIDPVQLCPDCEIIRTPRSRHCGTCNQCVERFDHHCPWINNCIGINNHKYFMVFIFLLVCNISINFVLTAYNLYRVIVEPNQIEDHYHIFSNYLNDLGIMNEAMAFWTKKYVVWGASALVLIITFFFIFPVLLLFTVHIKNFC